MLEIVDDKSEVYLNGQFVPLNEAKISVLDRGFIFGDGVYEVVPVYYRKTFLLEEHVDRLIRSLDKIRLKNPLSKQEWMALMKQMAQRSTWDNSLVYLQVTRGVARRNHAFPNPEVEPTVFLMSAPLIRPTLEMLEKGFSAVRMDDTRWLHCDIKSTSLLGNVLAKQYAVDHQVDDVIMFRDGYLTEASSLNAWIVKDGAVKAPVKDNLILPGIRYQFMQQLCEQEQIPFEAEQITEQEVNDADEIMLTSATKEVVPVTLFNGKAVGTGVPGPIFKQLKKAYDKALEAL